ncbi:MAG: formimidoylglutamate deiminase [Actinobacteria bacterium]|nr:formimidoylglutamate deiminase [Actinomycetota bacterium]
MTRWFAPYAWLPSGDGRAGHVARDVTIDTDGDRITEVAADSPAPADAKRLSGVVLPGLANVHSHAFHRALRGRTEQGAGDFWSWRQQMYTVAARLQPDSLHALARATFAEMALAGVTAVGEFHYVHHDPSGRPYDDPNEMGHALVAAAADAGVRLTLIDTVYLRGGFDRDLDAVQRRFTDGDVDGWQARTEQLPTGGGVRLAVGVHSVRAVPGEAIGAVAAWAEEHAAPLHVHLSEQPAENAACLAATGRTPTALLAEQGALGATTTAVHATHLGGRDIAALGDSATTICLCPTTERSLADGVGPAAALRAAGCPLTVGSDSHAMIDLFEEARAIELNERLQTRHRGHHRPADLLTAATAAGMDALGWDAGRLEAGRLADLVAVDISSPRLAGMDPPDAAAIVFAATAADVTDVVVGGRRVVADRCHTGIGDVSAALRAAVTAVTT